jgi:S1-C subfamily serine protease
MRLWKLSQRTNNQLFFLEKANRATRFAFFIFPQKSDSYPLKSLPAVVFLGRMKKALVFPLLCLSAVNALAAEGDAPQTGSVPTALRQLSNSFASVFEKAAPSVVVIEAKPSPGQSVSGLPSGLEFFFRGPNGAPYRVVPETGANPDVAPSIGSGFIFSKDGYILTNNHVVADASEIQVKLQDGRRFEAEVVGTDERSDVAVIKISASDLNVALLGDSDALRVGELAFAIGTPMELPYTFTSGIISAKGRTLGLGGYYDEFIQTDTSINPGNSGGPLCDVEGRVVGINTLISGINRGVGFAIPINSAKHIADQLIAKGRVSRPWLGISIASIEEDRQLQKIYPTLKQGVVLRGIEPGAPAQRSDLIPGDVITKVDGKSVQVSADLQREILGKNVGQPVELEIWRKGRTLRVSVQTGEQPDKFVRASTRSSRGNRNVPPQPPNRAPVDPASPGLTVADISPELLQEMKIQRKETGGVIVTYVEPLSAAAVAGLELGDIITEAGGMRIHSSKDFDSAMKETDAQGGILLLLERAGQKTFAILKP